MYLVKMTKNDEVRQDDQQNGRFGQESPPPPPPPPPLPPQTPHPLTCPDVGAALRKG